RTRRQVARDAAVLVRYRADMGQGEAAARGLRPGQAHRGRPPGDRPALAIDRAEAVDIDGRGGARYPLRSRAPEAAGRGGSVRASSIARHRELLTTGDVGLVVALVDLVAAELLADAPPREAAMPGAQLDPAAILLQHALEVGALDPTDELGGDLRQRAAV